jgi:hypothetical protein
MKNTKIYEAFPMGLGTGKMLEMCLLNLKVENIPPQSHTTVREIHEVE